MRVGLTLATLDAAAAEARLAEELGFDYVAAGEHLFFHGPTPNAFIALAAAAGATSRIRLVSSVALLPLYPAALAAKLVASLDNVCAGRFELGVGAGGEYPAEFAAAGVDVATRSRRLDEALEVMRLLFTGERISYRGEFTRLDGVSLDPPPVQRPGPRVWVGGRKGTSIRRAARFGDVWMPYMVTPAMLAAGLADVRERAAAHGRTGPVSGALFAWVCVDPDGDWARASGIAAVSAAYAQDLAPLAARYLLLGTPSQVVARLDEFAAAGAETVLLAIAAPRDDRERVVHALASEVVPRLARI